MVDDQVGQYFRAIAQGAHIVPRTQAWVDLGVVDGIEAGIGAVYRPE